MGAMEATLVSVGRVLLPAGQAAAQSPSPGRAHPAGTGRAGGLSPLSISALECARLHVRRRTTIELLARALELSDTQQTQFEEPGPPPRPARSNTRLSTRAQHTAAIV